MRHKRRDGQDDHAHNEDEREDDGEFELFDASVSQVDRSLRENKMKMQDEMTEYGQDARYEHRLDPVHRAIESEPANNGQPSTDNWDCAQLRRSNIDKMVGQRRQTIESSPPALQRVHAQPKHITDPKAPQTSRLETS